MNYLETNLAALAKHQPQLARELANTAPHPQAVIETSRNGQPALRVGQLRLCSTVDPEREGQSLARTAPHGPLACLGLGLGYHLEPLMGRDLVVWEPDAGLLRLALEARDLSALLSDIRLVVDPDQLGDLSGRRLFVHRPSARLYPLEARGLARRLDDTSLTAKPRPAHPRVLVVPPVWGGSLPIAYWCAEALTQLGCEVFTVPIDSVDPLHRFLREKKFDPKRKDLVEVPMVRFLGELTILMAEEFQPDLVFAMAQAPLAVQAIEALNRLGMPTAFWFIENYRHMDYFRHMAAVYSHFFHIQGQALETELDRLGANHSFLPVAAHPPVHRPIELTEEDQAQFGAPVGFMGHGYPNRQLVFSRLVQWGLPLGIWGTAWPKKGGWNTLVREQGRRLTSDEVVKVYNACPVVLNLHSSPTADDGVAKADFINPRTFEVAACGGFQLVDRVQGLEKLFAPGREIAVFASEGELLEMARHYLANPEERARIAQAGRRRVLNEHTYYHRMERMLTKCLGPADHADDATQAQPTADAVGDQAVFRVLQSLTMPQSARLN
jgi:spore maturation protein CgeB